jgi:hypothetical protein
MLQNLRIAVGYRTEHRGRVPEVLASGIDPAAIQAAIDAAPPEFLLFETGIFTFQRKARRNSSNTTPAPPTDTPQADESVSGQSKVPSAAEQQAADGQPGDADLLPGAGDSARKAPGKRR